mgnify:CR=1 FL=1
MTSSSVIESQGPDQEGPPIGHDLGESHVVAGVVWQQHRALRRPGLELEAAHRGDEEVAPTELEQDLGGGGTADALDRIERADRPGQRTRRRGIEYSMDSDRPGMLIRKKLMELLAPIKTV